MDYKRVKKTVPWCYKCNQEIIGNGSFMFPYRCKCGEYKYSENDYVLKVK